MKRKKVSRKLSRLALRVAEGLFASAVDLTLWFIHYTAELSVPQSSVGRLYRSQASSDRFLDQVNYEVIKNALNTARKKGFITYTKRHAWPEVTKEGKRRLANIIPSYDEKRLWDKRMHLVTYDIPEKKRNDRAILRDQLRRIGCGRLQDSVWITPYNPIDLLRSFIEDNNLSGTVVVSDLGKDGSIGEENLQSLVVRIYKLDSLNLRYEDWLEDVASFRFDRFAVVRYLSILRKDPQLPFELLPLWWKGDKAYRLVKDYLN